MNTQAMQKKVVFVPHDTPVVSVPSAILHGHTFPTIPSEFYSKRVLLTAKAEEIE